MVSIRALVWTVLCAVALSGADARAAPTLPNAKAQQAMDELLAADRAYGEASGEIDLVDGISAMFADDVVMPIASGEFAESRESARAALATNPVNQKARARWAPERGAMAADGLHGMTLGQMTLIQSDQRELRLKYLAYWIKRVDGWKVAAYKRVRSGAGESVALQLAPVLPTRMLAPTDDIATLKTHRQSLDAAERAFSDAAQKIGLSAAFVQYGANDSINLGGPASAGFVVGATHIGQWVGEGVEPGTSPVRWAADRVIVASSGDLGVSIGKLTPNTREGAQTGQEIPFFTVWHRADPTQPWRYLAE